MNRLIRPVAFIAFCMFIFGACEKEVPKKEVVRPVRAMKVGDATGFVNRFFPGQAKATREVELSFRVPGPLILRPIDVGDEVKQGQVLARIDPRDYEVRLRNAQSQLARAKANLKAMRQARPEDIRRAESKVRSAEAVLTQAMAEYNRILKIKEQDPGAVSGSMIDLVTQKRVSAEANLRNAKEELSISKLGARPEDILAKQSEIRALEAEVDSAKDQLRYTHLNAPFDSTVVAIYVENYEFVQARQPIARLVDHDRIEMIINIPENLISYASQIKGIHVRYDPFPNVEIPALIKEVGKEASQTTRTYPVTLIMDQPEGIRILPGMAGKAYSKGGASGESGSLKIEIPETAIFSPDETQKTYVWVIDETSKKVNRREVKTGALSDFGITIEQGLKPGEWVATAGVHYLREGQGVKLLKESTKEGSP
ncbi:MAG: efflux RND transporter periplasmic adaptor subunit [Deltaproteobacteria bacterium]|nr:efflux RND transporter periplasmic adaptor subunit [Deltaproteobacteria bacterium]